MGQIYFCGDNVEQQPVCTPAQLEEWLKTPTMDALATFLQHTTIYPSNLISAALEGVQPFADIFAQIGARVADADEKREIRQTAATQIRRTIEEERGEVKQRIKDEAIRIWQNHPDPSLLGSRAVARSILDKAERDEIDITIPFKTKSESDNPRRYAFDTIRDLISPLKPKKA